MNRQSIAFNIFARLGSLILCGCVYAYTGHPLWAFLCGINCLLLVVWFLGLARELRTH
jgi:hypothetical protein